MLVPVQQGPAGAAGPAGPPGAGVVNTTWNTLSIPGGGASSATTTVNIGAAGGSLIAIRVVQTVGAGAGSNARVDVYDRDPSDPSAKWVVAIGTSAGGVAFPADLTVTGPGQFSGGTQWCGAIGLVPFDGANVWFVARNLDGAAQTQLIDLWWIA